MSEVAENNQYYRGKIPIMAEFSNQHRALLSTVASRNFSQPPGFLYEASLTLEEASKNKLSALNYTIVSEAITRELKQTGHNYTETYKAARIAFELEKQTLLTALQQEFADLDAIQSLKKEELNRLFIELDIRRLILITTKTAIQLEMEALKQELAEIDRLTFFNETLLINEKVVTATAKLAIIPHLESLIESQERILTAEEANLPYMEALIDEKELLVDKKLEIVPYLEDKATTLIELSTAILAAIEIEESRLDIALSKTELGIDKVDNSLRIIAAEQAIEALRALLYTARNELQIAKVDRQISLTDLNGSNISAISTGQSSMAASLAGYKVAIASSIRNAKGRVSDEQITTDEEANDLSVDANESAITSIAGYQAASTRRRAEISATAEITSKLIHLIGS